MIKRISLKLGNMRKAAEFIVYPHKHGDTELMIQSDKRIAKINLTTGKGVLSSGKDSHPGFHCLLPFFNPLPIEVDAAVIEQLKGIQPKSGDEIGRGVYVA